MRKMRRLSLILALIIIMQTFTFATVATDESSQTELVFDIPVCDPGSSLETYYTKNGTTEMMSAEQAETAGVEAGFSGNVLKITQTVAAADGMSFCLDLRQTVCKGMNLSDIKTITFKYWVPEGNVVTSIRLETDAKSGWNYNQAPEMQGVWVSLTVSSSIFANDGNGGIAPFVFAFRTASNVTPTMYFDGVSVEFNEGVVPPTEGADPTETETTAAPETTVEETTAAPESETVDPNAVKEEIPFCDAAGGLTGYSNTQTTFMNSTLAASSGVPTGYEGYVMSLCSGESSPNTSICIDLRQSVCKDIKISEVESVTFRVCASDNTTGIRIKTKSDGNWQVNTPPAATGEWIDFEVTDMSIFVDDGNGYFSPFVFAFRGDNETTNNTSYIDSITVKLKEVEDETTAAPEPEKPYYTFEDGMGKEEIPYGEHDNVGSVAGYSNFKMMNETQAAAAGVPKGYSGWVLAVDPKGTSSISFGLDLTDIRTMDIERIRFRLWCPTGTKVDTSANSEGGIRITGNGTSAWNMMINPTALEEWIEVVFEPENFNSFDYDGDGYCNPMNFYLRYAAGTAYIDHIIVELRDPDTEPPVITYNGDTVIETREGREFVLDISAHDAYYDVDVELEYIWSEGALDANGLPVEGNHTCTVRATDEAGNTSEIELTVNVGARDTEAPTVSQLPTEIYAMVGAQSAFEVSVSDNIDNVDAVFTWSDGAIDAAGRLCVGDHTLTVTATDLTGNESKQEITVHVLETRPVVGELVQDS